MNYLQRLIKSLLIKAAGHKYIKRIPVSTTKTGKVRYRYIYNVTHTVGGKHLLDDAHLQTGTKLMLHSKEGEEVHVHVESVDGDKVKVVFDDGKNKGEEKTYSKEKLLSLFNKEHGVQDKLDEKKKELQESIREGKSRGLSDKQINRLKARLNRLGGGEEEKEEENIPTTGKIMKRILELGAKSKELTQIKGLVRGFLENEHTILSEYSDEIAIPLNNLLIRHYDLLEKEFGADDVVDSLLQLEDRGEDSMINQYVVKVLTKERAEREPAQKLKELGDDYLKAIGRLYEPVGYKSLVEQHRKLSLIRIANAGKALNENIKSLDTNKEHNTLQDLESTYSLIRNLKDLDTKLRNYPYKEAHKATKMYNQMLEQSMKENNQVLNEALRKMGMHLKWAVRDKLKKIESGYQEDAKRQLHNDKRYKKLVSFSKTSDKGLPEGKIQDRLDELERSRKDARDLMKYGGRNYELNIMEGDLQERITALEERAKRLGGELSRGALLAMKKGDDYKYRGITFILRSKRTLQRGKLTTLYFVPKDNKDGETMRVQIHADEGYFNGMIPHVNSKGEQYE